MNIVESILVYLGSQLDFVWKKITSRKFLLALAGAGAAYINGQWEILQGVVIAYLAAEGLDDFIPALKSLDFKQMFSKNTNAGSVSSAPSASDNPSLGEAAGDVVIPPTTAEAPQPVIPIPFDKEAFMQQVEEKVVNDYGTRNACTLFYEAQIVLNKWSFNNPSAWEDAKAFMLYLAGNAFKEVWDESYDDALVNIKKPDKNGCTYPSLEYKAMQYGLAYYSILLEYKRIKSM